MNNTNYAEKVDLVRDVNNETYLDVGGYKETTLSEFYGFDDSEINFIEEPREPEALLFERESLNVVRINGEFEENGWVVFKDQYIIRWKAFMDGREVGVYANNHDLILVNTVKGNEIILKYSVLAIEKIFGIASLIGFIGLVVFLLFLLRD